MAWVSLLTQAIYSFSFWLTNNSTFQKYLGRKFWGKGRSARRGTRTPTRQQAAAVFCLRPGRATPGDMPPWARLEPGERRKAGGAGGVRAVGMALRAALAAAVLGMALGAPLQWEVCRPPALASLRWAPARGGAQTQHSSRRLVGAYFRGRDQGGC